MVKVLLVLGVLAALIVAGRALGRVRGSRLIEHPIATLATMRAPARLVPWAPRTDWTGTHLRLSRFMNSIRAMGSATPTHEDLQVSQVAPRQLARLGDSVARFIHGAFEHLEDVAWAPAEVRAGKRVRVAAARYVPNGLNEPAWMVEAVDPARGLVVGYRGLQAQISREAAQALVDTVLTSYALTADLAAWFGGIERDLGAGIVLSLPVQFFDPYMLESDASGVWWMLFRHHPDAADDRDLLERALAVAAFFAPGNTRQAAAARTILRREALREATIVVEPDPETDGPEVALAHHEAAGRPESAWLVTGVDDARGVGVTLRLWQQDATRAEALAIVTRALASYRFEGDPARFAPSGGRP